VRWLSVLVVALALLAAGCGGGSNESAATTETTTTSETSTTETTTTEETTGAATTDTTDLSSVLGDKDCLALASVGATMAKAFSGTSGLSDDNSAELDQLASKVPEEIRADVETLAQAFSQYASKLKDIGITPGTTPSADQLQQLQAALVSIDQQEVTAASQRIETWSKANCTG
jgi:hypothetical protein